MLGAILAKWKAKEPFELIGRHDLDALMEMFHDDAVFEFPGESVLGGSFEGKEEIRAWFERMFDRMPGISFTVRHVLVDNIFAVGGTNSVHVEWDLTQTETDGRTHHLTGVSSYEVEGGKARRVKDYIFDQDVLADTWPPKEAATS